MRLRSGGNNIIYKEELKPKQTVADDLKDYPSIAANYISRLKIHKQRLGESKARIR